MPDRITIARPVVNIKASRRHRNPPPSARLTVIQPEVPFNGDISLLEDYENRLMNLAKSYKPGSTLSIIPSSLVLFLGVHLVKQMKLVYFSCRKFRYPSLIVASICSSITFSLLLFPFFTLTAMLSISIVIKYRKLIPVASRKISRATSAKLSYLEAHVNDRGISLRLWFEQHTGRIIGRLEQQQQENSSLSKQTMLSPGSLERESSSIPTTDPELGQLAPNWDCSSQTLEKAHHLSPRALPLPAQGHRWPPPLPQCDIRSQKLSVLRELRPDIDLELNRLRLIPQFDAEGWLLVNNPDLNAPSSEEMKNTSGVKISFPSNDARRKRLSL